MRSMHAALVLLLRWDPTALAANQERLQPVDAEVAESLRRNDGALSLSACAATRSFSYFSARSFAATPDSSLPAGTRLSK